MSDTHLGSVQRAIVEAVEVPFYLGFEGLRR